LVRDLEFENIGDKVEVMKNIGQRYEDYDECIVAACQNGHLDVVEYLLFKFEGTPLHPFNDDASKSGLVSSVIENRNDVARFLVKDPRCTQEEKDAALFCACRVNIELVKMLLYYEADPNAINTSSSGTSGISNRLTPVQCVETAIDSAKVEILELLLSDKRVVPNVTNCLKMCFHRGSQLVFKVFIDYCYERNLLDPSDVLMEACHASGSSLSCVTTALNHPKLALKNEGHEYMVHAIITWNSQLVHLLLKDNRINPCKKDLILLAFRVKISAPEILVMLLGDSRVNPKNLKLEASMGSRNILSILFPNK
jgi:hypothetical protein